MNYFDNNATTAVNPLVIDAMIPYLNERFGNPSSSYSAGRAARMAVSMARMEVARFLGAAEPEEIVFTSGGTESDNWALAGALEISPEKRHIVTTRVEHEAVRKFCEKFARNSIDVTWLDVDENGILDSNDLRGALRPDTAVVSIMLANNETGILFPVKELARIVKSESGALFHCDGVNAAGKILIDLKSTAIDLFSISGHKFHGPKGVGALYVRGGTDLPSGQIGGGQEHGLRAGTEAVHQIVGLGAASALAADLSPMSRVEAMRNRLEDEILDKIPNSRLNGTHDRACRLPNTSSIAFENTNGEMILSRLDDAGFSVSTGSACNAENHVSSAVLQAMNVPYSSAMGTIRFSLGRFNTDDEVSRLIAVLPQIVESVRSIAGR
jgi:cysteine desulfurase